MNCSNCNNALPQDAHFCTHCGSPVVFTPQAGQYYASGSVFPGSIFPGKVTRNLQSLGVLWLVYAGLRLLSGLAGVFFLHGFFGHHSDFSVGLPPFAQGFAFLWPAALMSLMVSVGCALLTGYGLMTRQPWGRILAIIFAIFALIHIPFGTAIGIYTLWVLGSRMSGDEYNVLSARA